MSRVSVVGVPNSAGSYAAGQDQAPAALRAAGLIGAMVAAGLEVNDAGDLPAQVWTPDRAHPYAQNAGQVATCLRELTNRLRPLFAAGDTVLALGGNCTIALSVMAALQGLDGEMPGLLYIDRHFDMNIPTSTRDGALDWMGMAHALLLPGCVEELTAVFDQRPLSSQAKSRGSESRRFTPPTGNESSRVSSACMSVPAPHFATILPALLGARLQYCRQARLQSMSTSTCWTSQMPRLRRTPMAGIADRAWSSSAMPSRWRRWIRGFAPCPSASSTRPVPPANQR